ncbi:MAG: ATP-dependent DNA helicase RecG [Patescibacteria group bacterium]
MDLKTSISAITRITPAHEKALKKMGLSTVEDLLYYFPRSYGDSAEVAPISSLEKGQLATIFGTIKNLKTKKGFRTKIPMAEGTIEDESGSMKIVWFHQAYLAKMLSEGARVRVEGKVSQKKDGSLYFSNPKIEPAPTLFTPGKDLVLYPVYPESRGVTSNWIYHTLGRVLTKDFLDSLTDPIPEPILKTYKLPNLKTALVWLHTPQKKEHADIARKRFAFEEIFFIQLEKQKSRHESQEKAAFVIEKSFKDVEVFVKRFPFSATAAQKRAIEVALADFEKGYPMSRLLEGDVGSGKTAVAATLAYAISTTRPFDKSQGRLQSFGTLQTAYMAPTEILAQQHFESFIKYFSHLPINIALITGSGCRKFPSKVNPDGWTDISRTQLLKWVASGEITVLIGTHALIQKSVKFKHLALAVVDEQHRFGIKQRQALVNKSEVIPHLLSMTATPIPRTLALTLYGDLDLTLLDEMPAGRKRIITEVVAPALRNNAYEKIRTELKAGRQLYVICPRIDEPDPNKEMAVLAKSVKEEAKRLKEKVFPEYRIEIIHSKMKPAEKDATMQAFKDHRIDILVSTSVVEVGVSVENASLIIIEGAERFGLSQLHQLRGRVLRGNHQPYCFVFTESKTDKTFERMKALTTAKNGFELAEFDLQNRGAGALAGTKQWGISDLAMEAIKNLKMVEAARAEAQKLVEQDPTFRKYPAIQERLASTDHKIHFE